MEYYSAIKKNDILPSVATWTDLLGIMLSEISQTGTSLVVQWLGIHLPVQGMQVQSLVRELRSQHSVGQLSPEHWNQRTHASQLEKPMHHNQNPCITSRETNVPQREKAHTLQGKA